jgi:hypothetical protein
MERVGWEGGKGIRNSPGGTYLSTVYIILYSAPPSRRHGAI